MIALPPNMQVIERGWLSANLILFKGLHQSAAVDSGYVSHANQTVHLVKAVLNGRPLDWLLNTHLHSDHCGGNAALQAAFPNLETLIPPGHASHVSTWDPVALTYEPTGQRCPSFKFDGLLQPGSDILLGDSLWQIHAARGHDPHSVLLFQAEHRCLISADALWENGFGVVFPELEGSNAFSEVGDTLDLIESLRPLTIIPGHGPVFSMRQEVLAIARSRLAAFVSDPVKHAKHAAKVLMKFKLLEIQSQSLDEFITWAEDTSYLRAIHDRHFSSEVFDKWLQDLTSDLTKSGVARLERGVLYNA